MPYLDALFNEKLDGIKNGDQVKNFINHTLKDCLEIDSDFKGFDFMGLCRKMKFQSNFLS